jgi:hypothetical protein
VPVLISLALDPSCPKRTLILRVVDDVVANAILRDGAAGVPVLERAIESVSAPALEDIAAWARALERVLAFVTGRGPVTLAVAREVAHALLIGVRRPGAVVDEHVVDGWLDFVLCEAHGTPAIEHLYVSSRHGRLVWSPQPLEAATLTLRDGDPRL